MYFCSSRHAHKFQMRKLKWKYASIFSFFLCVCFCSSESQTKIWMKRTYSFVYIRRTFACSFLLFWNRNIFFRHWCCCHVSVVYLMILISARHFCSNVHLSTIVSPSFEINFLCFLSMFFRFVFLLLPLMIAFWRIWFSVDSLEFCSMFLLLSDIK